MERVPEALAAPIHTHSFRMDADLGLAERSDSAIMALGDLKG